MLNLIQRFSLSITLTFLAAIVCPAPIQAGLAPGPYTLLTPAEGQTLNRHELLCTWEQAEVTAAAASWYYLCITASDGHQWVDTWLPSAYWWSAGSVGSLPAGDYTWWVQAWNTNGLGPCSQTNHFTLEACAPSAPTLLNPSGTVLATPAIQYSWASVSSSRWYELCVVKDSKIFADKWFDAPGLQGTNCEHVLAGHSTGQYFWWVRGWNLDGLGAWSSPGAFSVSLPLPGAVTLYSPTGAVFALYACKFKWSADPSADWYYLYINRNNTNHLAQWIQGVNGFTLTNYLPAGHYTWWVQPWNSEGLGPWSAAANFTIPAVGEPNSPTGRIPTSADQCYSWSAASEPETVWFELYVIKDGLYFLDIWVWNQWPWTPYFKGTGGTCVKGGHSAGNYTWWVRGWNESTGLADWSAPASFTMAP